MRSWRLVDADPIARDHKYTFYKPSRELISKVQVGELVKLIFAFDSDDPAAPRAERMWVRITRIDRGEAFVGELESEPIYITDLQCGDSLEFSPCHIINTERDDPNNIVERFARRCFVTRRVLDEGYPVGYLYREKPDRADDSGWRLLAGDDTWRIQRIALTFLSARS